MRKTIATIGLALLIAPLLSSAQSITELQAQIQALLTQIQIIEAQLGVAPPPPTPNVSGYPAGSYASTQGSTCLVLSRTLSFGSRGEDVGYLQRFLAQDPTIYPDGSVTGYFGLLTQAAVQGFQAKHGIVSSGSAEVNGYGAVGPRTRALIQSRSCLGAGSYPNTPNFPTIPTTSVVVGLPCTGNGFSMPSGASATFYFAPSVTGGTSCQAQTRQCVNGLLTGDPQFQYSSCSIVSGLSCSIGGTVVPSGTSQIFYSQSSAPFGQSCSSYSQARACQNGIISGSSNHIYSTCSSSTANRCPLDGVEVDHGSSKIFYSQTIVPFGSNCSSYGQTRACTNGTLSGDSSYNKAACITASTASCTQDGATVANNSSKTFYSSANVASGITCASVSQSRTCTNGILGGSSTYQYATCTVAAPSACVLDGVSVAHNTSRDFYNASTVPFGSTCSKVSRLCTNGSFPSSSDAYNKATCTVAAASSCTYNSETVAHGGSRTFFKNSSVLFGQVCNTTANAKSRTCSNGAWSTDIIFTNSSCAVGAQSAPTCSISASPSTLLPNQATSLNWTTQNATGGTLFGTAISPVASGSRVFGGYSSTGDRTITLSVTGGGGSGQCSTTLKVQNVLPPSCTLKARKNAATTVYTSPVTVLYSDTLALDWTSTGATDYASSTSSVGTSATTSISVASGSHSLTPRDSSYTYTFNNAGGSTQCTMTVNYSPPTCTLATVPSTKDTYIYGDPVTLTWSSSNSDYATATSSDRNLPNGTVTIPNVKDSATYTFTFNGRGGQQTCTKAITVQKPLSVLQPTGGTYQRANDVTISWQYTGTPPANTGVYLMLTNLAGEQVGNAFIASQQDPTSAYVWTVPETLGTHTLTSGDYKIRAVAYTTKTACTTSGCGSHTIVARADSGTITISIPTVTGMIMNNLANALTALEGALKEILARLFW